MGKHPLWGRTCTKEDTNYNPPFELNSINMTNGYDRQKLHRIYTCNNIIVTMRITPMIQSNSHGRECLQLQRNWPPSTFSNLQWFESLPLLFQALQATCGLYAYKPHTRRHISTTGVFAGPQCTLDPNKRKNVRLETKIVILPLNLFLVHFMMTQTCPQCFFCLDWSEFEANTRTL